MSLNKWMEEQRQHAGTVKPFGMEMEMDFHSVGLSVLKEPDVYQTDGGCSLKVFSK